VYAGDNDIEVTHESVTNWITDLRKTMKLGDKIPFSGWYYMDKNNSNEVDRV